MFCESFDRQMVRQTERKRERERERERESESVCVSERVTDGESAREAVAFLLQVCAF